MADKPVKKARSRKRPTYVNRPNAICVTVHSQDGSPVSQGVLNEAADAVLQIALKNNLLINLATT